MKRWVFVALALPCVAAAQSVRGTVLEQASQRPIAGAVVFLVDATQAVVARDLTSESGAYRLTAPRPGSYRVRTMRIGFRPVLSDMVRLGDGQDVTLPLAVESVPVSLATVRVERRANCPARQDATQAYNAWNEVTTALNAALLSSRMRGTNATIVLYDRWTEPGRDVVLRQGANVQTGLPGQPWRSIAADSLHKNGFVVTDQHGWSTFHAPDLDVLLSDLFLEDHCLRYHGVENGQIAIEFSPSRERDRIAEVRGFVWLDATTLELKRLQFRFVNVPREYEQADAGGELEFLKLRNGTWVISKWHIRMATAFKQERAESYGGLTARPVLRATEVKTTGGDLLRVVQNGDAIWALPPMSFDGRVIDSSSNRAIPGARVVVSGTSYSARTDESGRFRIDHVLPGAYTVQVHTEVMDSLATFHRTSLILANQVPAAEVHVPGRAELIARWCPALSRGQSEVSGAIGMLVGMIRNQGDSSAISHANVSVQWVDATLDNGVIIKARRLDTKTDFAGVYRACGVPSDHSLTVATEFDGTLPRVDARVGPSRIGRVDVWVTNGQRVVDTAAVRRRP